MIAATVATGLARAIQSAGVDPGRLLQKLGLDNSVLLNPDGFLPCSVFADALEEAAQLTGDDCFGLHFGERTNPKNIGPLVYAVLNSPTMAAGFETAARYLHVHNESAKLSLSVDQNLAYLRHSYLNLERTWPRQFSEYGMAVALGVVRIMAGSQWTPREVQFAHAEPKQRAEHLRVFGAPVIFGCACNSLVMEREFLDRTVPAADPRLHAILRRYLDDVLSRIPREDGIVASIRKAVAETMRDGNPKLTRVANKLATSPRTMQRQLAQYGLEFKELLDDTRRQFALEYLKDAENTLTEIAFLLGYSEVSAFNRAFKRWTGSTPSSYRHSVRSR
jgi:AraC-like DNA-binding protein